MSTRLYVSTNEASFFNTNMMGCSSSPPSEGSYIIGDFFISTVQQKGIFGWVCVESGKPGVWKDICNIGDINISIAENTERIEDLKTRVERAEDIVKKLELSSEVNLVELEKNVNEMIRDISDHDEDIVELKSKDTILDNGISDLRKTMIEHNNRISTNEGNIGIYEAKIKGLESKDSDLNTQVSRLDNKCEEIRSNLTTLTNTVSANKSDLEKTMSNIDMKNRDLESNIQTNIAGISDNKQAIQAINENLGLITGGDGQLSSINGRVAVVENFVNNVKDLPEKVASNTIAIGNMQGSINSLNNSLGLVNTMVENASKINTTVGENKDNIVKLNEEIKNFINNDTFNEFKEECNDTKEEFDSRLDVLETTVNTNYKTDLQNLKNKDTQIDSTITEIKENMKTNNDANTEAISNLNEQVESLSELPDKVNGIDNDVQDLTDIVMDDITNLADLKTAFVEVLNLKDCEVTVNNSWKDLFMCLIGITNVVLYPCTNITIDKTEITFDTIGQSDTIITTVAPDNTTDEIIWSTTNANVATVDKGKVVAVGNGECTIIVICGNKSTYCTVVVNEIVNDPTIKCTDLSFSVESVTVGADVVQYDLGEYLIITPMACTETVRWSSSKPSIASVSQSGVVTVKGIVGTTRITVNCGDVETSILFTLEGSDTPVEPK